MCTTRPGFTKLELIVVLSILTLLAGVLIPAVQTARESARKAHCSNNLRQIGRKHSPKPGYCVALWKPRYGNRIGD